MSTSSATSRSRSGMSCRNTESSADADAAWKEVVRLQAYYAPLLFACPDMPPSPYPYEAYRPFKAAAAHTSGVARREYKRASSMDRCDKQDGFLYMWSDFSAAVDDTLPPTSPSDIDLPDTVPPTSPPSHAACKTISLPDVESKFPHLNGEYMEDDLPELAWSPTSSLAPTRPNTPSSVAANVPPDIFAAALARVLVEDIDGVPAFGIGLAVYGDEYAVEAMDTDAKELDPLDELMGLAVV